jgi:hypothetical protein
VRKGAGPGVLAVGEELQQLGVEVGQEAPDLAGCGGALNGRHGGEG